jgi:hypothetical protein
MRAISAAWGGACGGCLLAVTLVARGGDVEVLRAVSGLPAHIAGRFEDLTVCRQAADGTFFVFDRRSHTVFSAARGANAPRELVSVGVEPGRILQPYAFDLAPDDTFVIADAPGNRGRVQIFHATGASLGGFALPGRGAPLVVGGVVMSGVGSLVYSGRSVYLSRPENGALVTEYALDGQTVRMFGELRATGHEQDRDLHLALNSGLVVMNPEGGFYFVFATGVPTIRKYDNAGKLVFQRHIEGIELDEYMKTRPTVWPRRTANGELPVMRPAVRAAAANATGHLWVSLDVPYTYVYDRRGDKQRVVQFRGAGVIAPTNLSFTNAGRILATPGCYLFDPRAGAGSKH